MDGTALPDHEQLLQLLAKLKEVFDVCDEDADGFIRIEHLVNLGVQFGQRDEVRRLSEYLDPGAQGKINFKSFCHGVFALKGCEEILKSALGTLPVPPRPPRPYETDNGSCYQEEKAKVPRVQALFPGGGGPSQNETQDSDMDSSDGGRSEERDTDLFLSVTSSGQLDPCVTSDLCARSPTSLISCEEQFEDYGESEDVDFAPGSPCPDDESRTNGCSDLGSSLPSSAGHTPQKMRHLCSSGQLDIYCSQCCRKVNLLNDLEARLRNLRANSPNRKISSTAFGRQLFHSSNFSSGNGSTDDLFHDSVDSCDVDITEKVSYLEKKVTELENDSLVSGDLGSKLRQENTQLVHRVHELEEQVKDQEVWAEQALEDGLKRHREVYSKMERDKRVEIELLNTRVQELEDDNGEMTVNVCRLRSQTERLDQEKQRMSDKLEDTSLRLNDEMDLYRRIMDKLWQNRHQFQKEKEAMHEVIEDLRRELDHLHLFKLEMDQPGQGRSTRVREIELEHEARRLKQENYKLRDQNDDLNGQILSLSMYEARSLFGAQSKVQSLAAEIDNASRDELVDALKEQEEINSRLRQYMDKIILAILEHNPSILEIKS
uniref:RAB11 family interacting protein 4 (class II) a n=2 Tax=Paramormyrops kingsleyae TaxID=1676925 RepID=A0A3B3S5Z3_9TELE|nr:rab11 family-interacting protein 4A-like isoform X1 [Paramormyrops kingsleyae]